MIYKLTSYTLEELNYLLAELKKLHQLVDEGDSKGATFLGAEIEKTEQEINRRK